MTEYSCHEVLPPHCLNKYSADVIKAQLMDTSNKIRSGKSSHCVEQYLEGGVTRGAGGWEW